MIYKTNLVNPKECKDALETVETCEHLLRRMKSKILMHVALGESKNESEFYNEYGRWEVSNAEIVRIAAVIRDELLDLKKKFEGVK